MNPNELPTIHVAPHLVSFENNRIFSETFDDFFHSKEGAVEEVRHVFIEGNDLHSRWQKHQRTFTIAELGFGVGVSLLTTSHSFLQNKQSHPLSYTSIEGFPVTKEVLSEFYERFCSLSENYFLRPLSEELIDSYPSELTEGAHRIWLFQNKICLTLVVSSCMNALKRHEITADAWFLDGFSPRKNSEMWSLELFEEIFKKTALDGTFSTYSASSSVKENAKTVGFSIQKREGFGRKREMCLGKKTLSTSPSPPPPNRMATPASRQPSVAIIGGGLAGIATALALAKRDAKITLFERNSALAEGASGNQRGVIMPHLSSKVDIMTQYYLSGYLYTISLIRRILCKDPTDLPSAKLKGALRLATANKWKTIIGKYKSLGYDAFSEKLSPNDIKSMFDLITNENGLLFKNGGSISPQELIYYFANNLEDKVNFLLGKKIEDIVVTDSYIQLSDNIGALYEFDYVVIANAYEASRFPISQGIPIEKIKGQLFSASLSNVSFAIPVCYDGYIVPIDKDEYLIGASYEHDQHDRAFSEGITKPLIDRLQQFIEKKVNYEAIDGRVCFRTTCPDRLPAAGSIEPSGRILCSLGHGSRGLTSTFIAGEVIADTIFNTPQCLPDEVLKEIHPKRFQVRADKKQTPVSSIYPASFTWRNHPDAYS